ncbi:MAG: VacJ family lipoprotein [Steroidobacteraceae bacterium]
MRMKQLLLALLVAGLLPACAALPPGERDPRDRFERSNRAVYKFNDALDRGIAKPVAQAYVKITPAPVRTGVSNFFQNLSYTTVIPNALLQGKLRGMFIATARLVVNTTIGIGGLFDPATQLGIPTRDEDFGQTLGAWGIPAGPYLVLPLLGPSTVRDTFGIGGDYFTDPKQYLVDDAMVRYGLTLAELVQKRASLLGTDDVLQRSYDPYVFLRNAYLERREYQVKDGKAPPDETFEIFDDSPPPDQGGTPAPINAVPVAPPPGA